MEKIAILASGSGTNAQNIIEYFRIKKTAEVTCVLSNKKDAYVLKRAENFNIPVRIFDRYEFYETNEILSFLKEKGINWIILAGFLWLVPENIVDSFTNRIINIHPALLPKFGGKGMYGLNVHRAVIENKEKETGISIHYVNRKYDEGSIIFQTKCRVDESDTPETLAEKVHKLEYRYFPEIIEKLIIESTGP